MGFSGGNRLSRDVVDTWLGSMLQPSFCAVFLNSCVSGTMPTFNQYATAPDDWPTAGDDCQGYGWPWKHLVMLCDPFSGPGEGKRQKKSAWQGLSTEVLRLKHPADNNVLSLYPGRMRHRPATLHKLPERARHQNESGRCAQSQDTPLNRGLLECTLETQRCPETCL